MQIMKTNYKRIAAGALGSLLFATSFAQARVVRRIENVQTTVLFSDNVSGGGRLDASLTLGPKLSSLDITLATSGAYNSRLSTRCSDGVLQETSRSRVAGTLNGDVTHICAGDTFPLRIEGAIDDL